MDELIARFIGLTIDWDGSAMADGEPLRADMTCGDLRQTLAALRASQQREKELLEALEASHTLFDRLISYHAPDSDGLREQIIATRNRARAIIEKHEPA